MTARTHDIFALTSLVAVASINPPHSINLYTLIVAVLGNNIGVLIPDIDQATNRLWDFFPVGDLLGKILRHLFWEHRTLTHSFLGVYLIFKGLGWLLPKVINSNFIDSKILLISIMIGYISHLVADSLTKEGLPLFFPLKLNVGFPPIKALRIRTGSWIEKFVVYPVVLASLGYIVINRQEQIKMILKLVSN